MKLKINLKDFWLDEDEELEPALKSHIIHEAVSKITKSIEEKVHKQIEEKITELMNQKMEPVIDNQISEFLITGEIKTKRDGVVLIKDHLKSLFSDQQSWRNPQTQLESIAKKYTEEMKKQYNAFFANHIVQGMKEQGLLKDDVVKMLTAPPKD